MGPISHFFRSPFEIKKLFASPLSPTCPEHSQQTAIRHRGEILIRHACSIQHKHVFVHLYALYYHCDKGKIWTKKNLCILVSKLLSLIFGSDKKCTFTKWKIVGTSRQVSIQRKKRSEYQTVKTFLYSWIFW